MTKRVVFRVDASFSIGTGHVMRCLTLADALLSEGFKVSFICRSLEGNMTDYIEERGFEVLSIPVDTPLSKADIAWDADFTKRAITSFGNVVEWLIVDHYGIDAEWEAIVKPSAGQMLIIDDLANRLHVGDILLDQNVHENPEARYFQLVPASCRLLLGPQYLLLRSSFYEQRRTLRRRSGKIERILVFFGGSDPTDETSKVLETLSAVDLGNIQVDIVIGHANSRRFSIERKCKGIDHVNLHVQVENMAELIAQSDFSLGSGGVAMWERCYLGLPSAVSMVADNQKESVNLAHRRGVIWNMGWNNQIYPEQYADILERALNSPQELIQMESKALEMMSSRADNAQNRVLRTLLEEQQHD